VKILVAAAAIVSKEYDSEDLREQISAKGATPVIPKKVTQKKAIRGWAGVYTNIVI